jgi:hypothetical protein
MLAALVRLCRDGQGTCAQATALREATLRAFGAELNQPPQYDGTYLRYLVAADLLQHDSRIADVVVANAQRIEQNAVDAGGFYLRAWNGSMDGISPGLISVHGAALEALAWAAVAAPPR